jgi:hypothetical protein
LAVASQLGQFHEIFADDTEPLGSCSRPRSCSSSARSTTCAMCRRPRRSPGQVLSGSVLSLLGVTMLYFRVPFATYEYVVLSPDLAPLVTVLTVVVMANAINLIDGLDGLACGIVMIAGAAMFLYADRLFKPGCSRARTWGRSSPRSPSASAWASCSTTSTPARIFMGDAGAMFSACCWRRRHHRRRRTADPRSAARPTSTSRRWPSPLVSLGVADLRHRVLVRAPRRATAVLRAGRPRAPAPPVDAHGVTGPGARS